MARRTYTTRGRVKLTLLLDDDKLELTVNKFTQSLNDMRRFWTEFFGPQFFDDVQQNFASEGRFVGGWRALSPKYAAWKLKHYGPRNILVRTGRMQRSLRMGAGENIFRAFKTRVEMGSSVDYMPYHQRGTRRMPRRQVLFFRKGRTYNKLLQQYVREEAQAAKFWQVRFA
jgi:hypothetical protein